MKKAFTLIELLVVVLIIGILSAIALPQYQRAVEKTRSVEAVQNLSALERAIDMYVLENGYPTQTVRFTGQNKQDVLNIDITSALDCHIGSACYSQHFAYSAYCDSNECVAYAERDGYDYTLRMTKDKATGHWTKECEYMEPKEYICAAMEAFGYTRSTCC